MRFRSEKPREVQNSKTFFFTFSVSFLLFFFFFLFSSFLSLPPFSLPDLPSSPLHNCRLGDIRPPSASTKHPGSTLTQPNRRWSFLRPELAWSVANHPWSLCAKRAYYRTTIPRVMIGPTSPLSWPSNRGASQARTQHTQVA